MKQVLRVALAVALFGPAAAMAQPYQPGGPQNQRRIQDNRAGGNQSRPAPAGPPNRGPARPGPARPVVMAPRGGPRGGHRGNWNRGERYDGHRYVLDWRRHHLRQPPRGYEWVNVNGQFLLIAITTGVIADILLNAR